MFEVLKRSGALYTHTHTHTGIQQIYTIIKEVLFKCLFNFKRKRGGKYLILSLCGSDRNE